MEKIEIRSQCVVPVVKGMFRVRCLTTMRARHAATLYRGKVETATVDDLAALLRA